MRLLLASGSFLAVYAVGGNCYFGAFLALLAGALYELGLKS